MTTYDVPGVEVKTNSDMIGPTDRKPRTFVHLDDAEKDAMDDVARRFFVYIVGDDRLDELREYKRALADNYIFVTPVVLPHTIESVRPLSEDEAEACFERYWVDGEIPTPMFVKRLREDDDD